MFEVTITGLKAKVTKNELLTTGTVGAQVKFTFSDDWADKTKTAVFKRCGKVIDVLESDWGEDNVVTIPPEMTEKAGQLVGVGIYGRNTDGKRATPTIYAPLGVVAVGADPSGDESADPSLPVYSQIQADLNNVKDDLNDVAKRAVQSDWNQNDPEQPDYVQHRIAYDESEYVLAGSDYSTWMSITSGGIYPISKVTVNGKTFHNVEATNKNTAGDNPYIAYQLDDTTTVTVYHQQMFIAPTMEMYIYSPKITALAEKFIPPISWIRGDKTANYITDRPGGYIEPSDDVIGCSERRTSGGNVLLPYAERIRWVSIDKTATRNTPVRITGMYVDGTMFDACCIFGAVYENAIEQQYGKNPFRFMYTDEYGVYSITAGVVKYCTIYAASAVPWSLPFLPTFTKNTIWGGYGLPRTPSAVSINAPYEYIRRNDDDLVYVPTLQVYAAITDIKTLIDNGGSAFFVQDDPEGYLRTQLGIEDLRFPIMIVRIVEHAASVSHNYLYIYNSDGEIWKGDIVTPGYYVMQSKPVYLPVYYCHIDDERTTDTQVVFTETNTFIGTLPADRVVVFPEGLQLPCDDVLPYYILIEQSWNTERGFAFLVLGRNYDVADDRVAYDVITPNYTDYVSFPTTSRFLSGTLYGTKITASDIRIPVRLDALRAFTVSPGAVILRITNMPCWFMPAPADFEQATPQIFSQIYTKNGVAYVASLTYVSSDDDDNSSVWILSEQTLFAQNDAP